MYHIRFEFDGGVRDDENRLIADPPTVLLWNDQTNMGLAEVEVFEEPTPTVPHPGFKQEHWQAGLLTLHVLHLLNTYPPPDSPSP